MLSIRKYDIYILHVIAGNVLQFIASFYYIWIC